jgi:hypothetical protein
MSPVTVTQVNRNISVTSGAASGLTIQSGGVAPATHNTYTHSQASAASTWTIVHNLACKPSVTIVDSSGNVQIGEVLYDSDNQVTVTFAAAFSGYAYLN